MVGPLPPARCLWLLLMMLGLIFAQMVLCPAEGGAIELAEPAINAEPAVPPDDNLDSQEPVEWSLSRTTDEQAAAYRLPVEAEGTRLALVELQCDFPRCREPDTYESLLSLTDLWPGSKLSSKTVSSAIHNLNRTGLFKSITPEVTVYSMGTVLVFHAVGATIVREVTISGNYPLLETEVRKRLFYRVGRHLDDSAEMVRRQEESVSRLFQQEGYFESKVKIVMEPMGPVEAREVRVKVVINKGARYYIGNIHVRGARHYTNYQAARHFTQFLNLGHFTPGTVRKGKESLTARYHDDGFFGARVRTSYQNTGKERKVDVYVDIDEGIRHEVIFKGNKALDVDELKERLTFRETMDVDAGEIERSAQSIRSLYVDNGFYWCQVKTGVVEMGPKGRRVLFIIEEGVRARVKQILFHGNLSFPDNVLKSKMVTTEKGFVSPPGYLSDDVLAEDMEALASFYQSQGFLHARIGKPDVEVLSNGSQLLVNVHVEEGTQTLVGKVTFKGNQVVNRKKLLEVSGVGEGMPFSPYFLTEGLGRIQAHYRQTGYPYTRLAGVCSIPPDNREVDCNMEGIHSRTVHLEVRVVERVRVVAGEFLVKGNFKTSEKVIRRAFQFDTGDPFDFHKLLEGQTRLRRLGLFESVNTSLIGFSEVERRDKVGIMVNVEEHDFKFLEFATGAQTVTMKEKDDSDLLTLAYWADARYIDKNLFGWGKEFLFDVLVGTLESQVATGYRDAQFLGRDLTFMLQAHALLKNDLTEQGRIFVNPRYFFDAEELEDNYNHFELAGITTVSKEFRRGLLGQISYKLEQVYRRDSVDMGVFQAEPQLLSHLIPAATLDFRDSPIHPTRGFYLWGQLDYSSSFLGSQSDSEFLRIMLDAQYYFPMFKQKLISASSVRFRWAIPFDDSTIGLENRFFLGGDGSVRGFPARSIGPTDGERFLGDNVALIFNKEFRHPLKWGFWGAWLYDAGILINTPADFTFKQVRHSTGLGLRYLIADQIPLRLDVARIIAPRADESSWGWNAALGYAF